MFDLFSFLDCFINLKKTFISNEKFILKHQSLIKDKGLQEAKLQEYFKEDQVKVESHQSSETLQDQAEKDDFVCNQCDRTFKQESKYKKHMQTHDQHRRECPKCPGKTFAPSTFVNHIREVHNIGKHVECPEDNCTVKFRKRGDMIKHYSVVHENKKELCTDCGEYFKNLKYHKETVHDGLRYKCNSCDKEYKTEKMLKQHVETVHEMRRSICEICAVEVIDLKNHMKLNHEGPIEKTEPCPDQNCDRKFRTCQEAQKHYKSFHLEIKEMCPICGGWFKALYQHTLAVHKNVKKHACADCGKAFSKKHDLLMHRNRVHLGIKYVCPHCGKQVSKLRDHIKLVHGVKKPISLSHRGLITNRNISQLTTETLDETLLNCPDDPPPQVPNISDIIKRCVSNIDHQMVGGMQDGVGDTSGLSNLIETVESETGALADFGTVYASSQLPSLHTVLQSNYRSKMDPEEDNHHLLADDAVNTNDNVDNDSSNNINMYQWLESSE